MASLRKISFVFFSATLIVFSSCSNKNAAGDKPPAAPAPQNNNDQNNSNPPNPDLPPKTKDSTSFKKIGVIREFGGTDNAALFGLLPDSGKLQINKVVGPGFLKVYKVGELNPITLEKLFLNTSKPLNSNEKQDLLSGFNGAMVIYAEGYEGNLCNQDEVQYEIKATGQIDKIDLEITFQFVASPNSNGNCIFHMFGIVTRYEN